MKNINKKISFKNDSKEIIISININIVNNNHFFIKQSKIEHKKNLWPNNHRLKYKR